jgi:hypothetical protein
MAACQARPHVAGIPRERYSWSVRNPFGEIIAYANSARLNGGTGGSPVEPSYFYSGRGGSFEAVEDGGEWIEEECPEQDFGGGSKYKKAGKRRRRRGVGGSYMRPV